MNDICHYKIKNLHNFPQSEKEGFHYSAPAAFVSQTVWRERCGWTCWMEMLWMTAFLRPDSVPTRITIPPVGPETESDGNRGGQKEEEDRNETCITQPFTEQSTWVTALVRACVNMEKSIVVLFLVCCHVFSAYFVGVSRILCFSSAAAAVFLCPLLFEGCFLCLFLASCLDFPSLHLFLSTLLSPTKVQLSFSTCSSTTIPEGSTFTAFQCFRVRIDSRQLRIHVKSRSHYLSLLHINSVCF